MGLPDRSSFYLTVDVCKCFCDEPKLDASIFWLPSSSNKNPTRAPVLNAQHPSCASVRPDGAWNGRYFVSPETTQLKCAGMFTEPRFTTKLDTQIVYLGIDPVQLLLQLPTPAVHSCLNQGPLKMRGNKARHSYPSSQSSLLSLLENALGLRGRFCQSFPCQEDVILAQKRPHNFRLRGSAVNHRCWLLLPFGLEDHFQLKYLAQGKGVRRRDR